MLFALNMRSNWRKIKFNDFRFSARLEHLLIEWKLDGHHRKSASTEVTLRKLLTIDLAKAKSEDLKGHFKKSLSAVIQCLL